MSLKYFIALMKGKNGHRRGTGFFKCIKYQSLKWDTDHFNFEAKTVNRSEAA